MKKILFLFFLCGLLACQVPQVWKDAPFFWGFALDGFPITQNTLSTLKEETKTHPEVILFYLSWPNNDLTSTLEAIWNAHAVPCFSWEPFDIPYHEILEGKYDDYIQKTAQIIKKWDKPLMIRFAHEMNLAHYHWGTTEKEYGPHSPEIYVKMFQYVVDQFRKEKVENALWVFCPNNDAIPNESWNVPINYYPGSDYIDILGMDGYNWDINEETAAKKNQSWTSPYRSFEQTFKTLYKTLRSLAPDKPIIVFETASADRSQPKEEWIKEALVTAKKWGIQGIIWFHVNKEEDWRMPPMIDLTPSPTFQDWLQSHIN